MFVECSEREASESAKTQARAQFSKKSARGVTKLEKKGPEMRDIPKFQKSTSHFARDIRQRGRENAERYVNFVS